MITEEDYLNQETAYPQGKYEAFFTKYFSVDTREEDRWLSRTFVGIELSIFTIGAIQYLIGTSPAIAGIVFTGILTVFGIFYLIYFFTRKRRTQKLWEEFKS